MKIVYVSTYDLRGGAARGAMRLHMALRELGVDSVMLVREKLSRETSVMVSHASHSTLARSSRWLGRQALRLMTGPGSYKSFNLIPTGVADEINGMKPDVVQLHWIGDDYVSVGEIALIRAPIIWRLADEWAVRGFQHYANPREAIASANGSTGLGNVSAPPPLERLVAGVKRRLWRRIPLYVVAGSRWLAQRAADSQAFENGRIAVIPNGIDTNVFRPRLSSNSRARFGIPAMARLILFGAPDAIRDPRKGFDILREALMMLPEMIDGQPLHFAFFGADQGTAATGLPMRTTNLGVITSDDELVNIYGMADVMVVPSLSEAFGQTALEAQACGTPVVAFASTGLLDIVEHGESGYLARPFSSTDLAAGISYVLSGNHGGQRLRLQSRRRVLANFTIEQQAQEYHRLYRCVTQSGAE